MRLRHGACVVAIGAVALISSTLAGAVPTSSTSPTKIAVTGAADSTTSTSTPPSTTSTDATSTTSVDTTSTTSPPTTTTTTIPPPPPITIGVDTNLGWKQTSISATKDLARLAAGGVHQIREDFRWDLIQPKQRSRFNWGPTDALMRIAARDHISVLAILDYTPQWATGVSNPYVPPATDVDFDAFARAVVKRYGDGGTFWASNKKLPLMPIEAIEVWNEPWYASTWVNPDPVRYAQMVRDVATTVRSIDPACKIVISIDEKNDWQVPQTAQTWYAALLGAFPDIGSYVDVGSVHLYFTGAAPDSSWFQPLIWIQYSNLVRGLSFPIWVTETNVNATDISKAQLGAGPNVILPAARTIQANEMTSVLTTLNQAPYSALVQRAYVFSDSRAMTMGWSSRDPLDSGFLLEGPKGVPMPELTAIFSWVAAN